MPDFRARSNVEIIDAAFQLYSRNFSLFFALGLIGAIPVIINLLRPQTLTTFMTEHTALFALFVCVAIIIAFLAYAAYITLAGDIYHERPVDLGHVLSKGSGRLGTLVIANILTGIVITIAAILLIIPGIYFAIRFAVVIPVSILENDSGTDPLYRSFALTKGHTWKIVGMGLMLLVILIMSAIIEKTLGLPPGVIGIVLGYLAAAALNPLLCIIGTIFYYDLRIRNEGYDIQALATGGMSTPTPAPAPAAS